MDPNTQAPVQPIQPVPQVAPEVQPITQAAPVVPISNQPLTLDPNQMTEPIQTAPVQPTQTTPPTILQKPMQVPQNPVSGPHKEVAPMMQAPVVEAPVSEYVRPTEIAPQLSQEVAEAGVEVVTNAEQPQLTQEHKDVGIEPAKEAVPVTIPLQPTIQLPYTAKQVKEIEKKVPISESKHWLAALTEYLLKKLGGATL